MQHDVVQEGNHICSHTLMPCQVLLLYRCSSTALAPRLLLAHFTSLQLLGALLNALAIPVSEDRTLSPKANAFQSDRTPWHQRRQVKCQSDGHRCGVAVAFPPPPLDVGPPQLGKLRCAFAMPHFEIVETIPSLFQDLKLFPSSARSPKVLENE